MKIKQRQTEIISSAPAQEFKIQASGKAFQILSSGLYSRKKEAVLRELGTNALDAHVLNGYSEPFDVFFDKTPDSGTLTIRIRDYGPGLNDHDIMNLYTTYFDSTKTDTNKMVGAFGLGSKSPFAVADSFIVHSHFDGVKTTYSIFLNNGIPSIMKLGEVETHETGIEIEIEQSWQTINSWEKAAHEIFPWFDTPPRLNGTLVEKKDRFYENEYGFLLNEKTYYSFSRGSEIVYAVCGGICYDVKIAVSPKFINPVVLKMPLGSVDITPSRESLGTDEKTIAALNTVYSKFEETFLKNLKKEVGNTLKEEVTYFQNMKSDFPLTRYDGTFVKYSGGDVTLTTPLGNAIRESFLRISDNRMSLPRTNIDDLNLRQISETSLLIVNSKYKEVEAVRNFAKSCKTKPIAVLYLEDDNKKKYEAELNELKSLGLTITGDYKQYKPSEKILRIRKIKMTYAYKFRNSNGLMPTINTLPKEEIDDDKRYEIWYYNYSNVDKYRCSNDINYMFETRSPDHSKVQVAFLTQEQVENLSEIQKQSSKCTWVDIENFIKDKEKVFFKELKSKQVYSLSRYRNVSHEPLFKRYMSALGYTYVEDVISDDMKTFVKWLPNNDFSMEVKGSNGWSWTDENVPNFQKYYSRFETFLKGNDLPSFEKIIKYEK